MLTRIAAFLVAAGLASGIALERYASTYRASDVRPDTTASQIALGDSIFHGKAAGGLCFTCHQPNARGIPGLAPDLTDRSWLHGDGSLAFIERVIEAGVPKPKQAAAPMLPKGGGKLSPEQVRAVAAYVYSLSHPKG